MGDPNFTSQETGERRVYYWAKVILGDEEAKQKFTSDVKILMDTGVGKISFSYVKLVRNEDRFTGIIQLCKRAIKDHVAKVLPQSTELRGIVHEDVDRAIGAVNSMITPGSDQEVMELGLLTRQGGARKRPNGETQDETEERVLVRLKDGEEEEEIFTALFEDDDTSGMHVLGKMSAYNDRYQTLQQSKKLKKIAEQWLKDHDLFPWQKTVMEMLERRADDWTIVQIVNQSGGIGKSRLVQIYEDLHPDECLVLDNSPSRENFYLASLKNPDKLKTIFFHFSRAESCNADFKSIEALKDGRFNSSKFRNKRCKFSHSPHVIIFSNKKANVNGLSYRRWRIGYVEEKMSDIQWFRVNEQGEEVRMENIDV